MAYKIFHSRTFDEELDKHDIEFKQWVDKIENQLVVNPYVGDPLGVRWCREKKHNKFRVYYLIYEEFGAVFMVAISSKTDLQKAINTIFLLLSAYKKDVLNLLKQSDVT